MNQEYIIKEKIDLTSFLLSKFSKKNVKMLLKNKCVLVNDKEVTKYDYLLNINDKIKLVKKIDDIIIVYEDKDIIIVDKPSNMLTVSDLKEKEKTLYYKVSDYLKSKNKNSKVFVVHRLDYETSGLVIFAKNQLVKDKLQNNWNQVKRGYQAVIHGKLKESKRLIFNLKENRSLLVYVTKKDRFTKESITNYTVVKFNDKYSLVNILIETGRKHQIRVSFKEIGHPIVGDKKYGNDSFKYLYLYANELSFIHPITKNRIDIIRPIKEEFKRLI